MTRASARAQRELKFIYVKKFFFSIFLFFFPLSVLFVHRKDPNSSSPFQKKNGGDVTSCKWTNVMRNEKVYYFPIHLFFFNLLLNFLLLFFFCSFLVKSSIFAVKKKTQFKGNLNDAIYDTVVKVISPSSN